MDFDKKARECTADFRDRGAAWDAVERNIAAALKAAYNEGLEDAIKATGMGGLGRIAVRAKKVR